jgi:hypothetical protein
VGYYGSLAFSLRLRGISESRIVEIMREVRDSSREAGQEPAQRFGPAEAYAAHFPKGNDRSVPTRVAIGVVVVAFSVAAVDLFLRLTRDQPLQIAGVRLIFVLLAVKIVAVVAAIVADHRVPPEFRAPSPQR